MPHFIYITKNVLEPKVRISDCKKEIGVIILGMRIYLYMYIYVYICICRQLCDFNKIIHFKNTIGLYLSV